MSAYDEYDCKDLGCGPQFCDYPHCKKPRLTGGAVSSVGTTVHVTVLSPRDPAAPTLDELHQGVDIGHLDRADWHSNRDDHQLGIEAPSRPAGYDPLCPACHAPRSLPHTDDCEIQRQVLADLSRIPGLPAGPVPGGMITILGHPFRGDSVPPPAPPSRLGPDRGE